MHENLLCTKLTQIKRENIQILHRINHKLSVFQLNSALETEDIELLRLPGNPKEPLAKVEICTKALSPEKVSSHPERSSKKSVDKI